MTWTCVEYCIMAGDSKPASGVASAISPAFFWALSYGLSSMAITLFNKAVLTEWQFQFPQVLTVCQGIFTIVCMYMLRQAGLITFQDLNWKVARQVAPLSAVFIFYVVISLAALGRVNVPMFTALRRTTLLFVMGLEYMTVGTIPTQWTMAATAVMTGGAMIAAAKDLTYDPISYGFVFLTNLGTALYTVNIAKVKREHKLDVFTMLWYNNLMTMPVLAVIALMSGEVAQVVAYPHLWDPNFQILFGFSATLAFWLNYSTYQSTSLNSPTTQSVIGQLKNFVAFALSLVLFSDYIYDAINFTGLLIGFSGGVWYSIMQMQAQPPSTEPEAKGRAGAGAAIAPTADDAADDAKDGAEGDEEMGEGDESASAGRGMGMAAEFHAHAIGGGSAEPDADAETATRPRII